MDALEEDACAVVTAPAFTAECPNATRPRVRVDGEPMAGMGQILSFDGGAGEEGSDLASKSEINLINNQKKP